MRKIYNASAKARLLQALIVVFLAGLPGAAAQAAGKAEVDRFYKPVTSKDLFVILPPRVEQNNRFDGEGLNFSGSGGCPEQIIIGSVTDDSQVYGGADINVAVNGDIIVNCGGLR